MTEQEAVVAIAEKVAAAERLITEAESIADEFKLEFSLNVAYGMGGWYNGGGENNSWCEQGWNPSSQSC